MRPADAILQTEPSLDDDFIESIRHMRGVDEAEGRRFLRLRISLDGKGETWRDLTIYALQDYNKQRLFIVSPQDGIWPPEKGQVLLERASLPYLGITPSQQILVKTPDGRKFHLTVTGRAHDLYRIPPFLEGWVYGYVNMETLRWMGEAEGYNELYISASDPVQVRALADKAADRIEGQGLPVYQKTLPNHDKPGRPNAREWQELKAHPELGQEICYRSGFDAEVCAIVLHHHERCDGSGYPDRLTHQAIPYAVRLVAVMDAFDALTSSRDYRDRLSVDAARTLIARSAGAKYCPWVVSGLLALPVEMLQPGAGLAPDGSRRPCPPSGLRCEEGELVASQSRSRNSSFRRWSYADPADAAASAASRAGSRPRGGGS